MLGLRLDEPLPLAGLEPALDRDALGAARAARARRAHRRQRQRDAHADRAGSVPRRRRHRRAPGVAFARGDDVTAPRPRPQRAPAADPDPRRRGVRRHGPAGRLEEPRRAGRDRECRRRPCATSSPSSSGSACSRIRTRRRAASRPTAATATTSTGCSSAASRGRPSFPLDLARGAQRGRVRAAGDDGDALAGHAADRARLGAAAPGRDRPPRRGAAAPAADRDGGRDHLDRRGDEARLRVRRPSRSRPRALGGRSTSTTGSSGSRSAAASFAGVSSIPASGSPSATSSPCCAPAFNEAEDEDRRVYVGGTAGLLDDVRDDELASYRPLIDLLERRRALLDLLAEALDPRRPFVRVGDELANPALRDLALVGAAYGIANRTLGAVSLIGPTRMDYDKAIRTVRSAASELSRFAEEIYGDN